MTSMKFSCPADVKNDEKVTYDTQNAQVHKCMNYYEVIGGPHIYNIYIYNIYIIYIIYI